MRFGTYIALGLIYIGFSSLKGALNRGFICKAFIKEVFPDKQVKSEGNRKEENNGVISRKADDSLI